MDKKAAEKSVGQAVEGLYNAKRLHELALRKKVEVPILNQVYRILHEDLPVAVAAQELLERMPGRE